MENHGPDEGVQFVLDNRKLLVLFAVLIAICGGFFFLGYVEGKRQGMQLGAQNASPMESAPVIAESAKTTRPSGLGADESVKKDLSWYQDMGGETQKDSNISEPIIEPVAKTAQPQTKELEKAVIAEPKTGKQPARTATAATKVNYSVQVGAFRQRKEAETKAGMLKAKGYESMISGPAEPGQLYLLKVGGFGSRADAVAMQLRLKKDGFTGFVKSN
jgi:cell division protein FtsN